MHTRSNKPFNVGNRAVTRPLDPVGCIEGGWVITKSLLTHARTHKCRVFLNKELRVHQRCVCVFVRCSSSSRWCQGLNMPFTQHPAKTRHEREGSRERELHLEKKKEKWKERHYTKQLCVQLTCFFGVRPVIVSDTSGGSSLRSWLTHMACDLHHQWHTSISDDSVKKKTLRERPSVAVIA